MKQPLDIRGDEIRVEAHGDGTVHFYTYYLVEDSRGRLYETGSDTIKVSADQAIAVALRLIEAAENARRVLAETRLPF